MLQLKKEKISDNRYKNNMCISSFDAIIIFCSSVCDFEKHIVKITGLKNTHKYFSNISISEKIDGFDVTISDKCKTACNF